MKNDEGRWRTTKEWRTIKDDQGWWMITKCIKDNGGQDDNEEWQWRMMKDDEGWWRTMKDGEGRHPTKATPTVHKTRKSIACQTEIRKTEREGKGVGVIVAVLIYRKGILEISSFFAVVFLGSALLPCHNGHHRTPLSYSFFFASRRQRAAYTSLRGRRVGAK